VLRRERPETRLVLAEPDNAALVSSGIAQVRGEDGAPAQSHPGFEPHPIQGWVPDFIPLVLQELLDAEGVGELVTVNGAESMDWARRLARKEGILTGISGGATLAAAMKVAASAPEGSVILAMLPDTGERYMTTPLFEEIPAEMDDEELALSRSTPGFQLD